jgi:hypothetical protein
LKAKFPFILTANDYSIEFDASLFPVTQTIVVEVNDFMAQGMPSTNTSAGCENPAPTMFREVPPLVGP